MVARVVAARLVGLVVVRVVVVRVAAASGRRRWWRAWAAEARGRAKEASARGVGAKVAEAWAVRAHLDASKNLKKTEPPRVGPSRVERG